MTPVTAVCAHLSVLSFRNEEHVIFQTRCLDLQKFHSLSIWNNHLSLVTYFLTQSSPNIMNCPSKEVTLILGLHKRMGGESERSNEMAFGRVGVTSSNILIIFLQDYTTTCNAAHLKWTDLFDKISIIRLPGLKVIDESLLEKFSIKKYQTFMKFP